MLHLEIQEIILIQAFNTKAIDLCIISLLKICGLLPRITRLEILPFRFISVW